MTSAQNVKTWSFVDVVVVCFQSEAQKQLEEIKSLREKMKEVAEEARGKEDLYKQLVMFGQQTRALCSIAGIL